MFNEKTFSRMVITDKARKEIEYQINYDIDSKVEKYNIPKSLIINFDQTPPNRQLHVQS